MTMILRPLLAAALILSLTACETISCPPGMHPGKYGHHCYPDRGPPPPR